MSTIIKIEVKPANDKHFTEIPKSVFIQRPFTLPSSTIVRFTYANGKVVELESGSDISA